MRIELIITTVTKPPSVPPAMAAIGELVRPELIGVAGKVDAPGVDNGLELVDSLEGVDVMIFELDESFNGFEVLDELGEVDVIVFELDEPMRLADMEELLVEAALDDEDDDNEAEPSKTLNRPE